MNDRIIADINSRQAEIDNLLKQKESQEIDREAEIQRLRTSESEHLSYMQQIQSDLLYKR